MKEMNNYISVVIPCYRSENTIGIIVEKTIEVLSERNNEFEIILVNDCSPDLVWNKINELHKKYPAIIKGINFTKNFGQHSALMAGYREAIGNIIVSFDDDGQNNPEDIWKLIDELNNGYDVVIAKYKHLNESLFRRIGSRINNFMASVLLDKPKGIYSTSFRVYKRYVIDSIIEYDKSYPYIGGLIYRSTKNIGQVEVEHYSRIENKSGYSFVKLIQLIVNGFTSFSIKPLRLSTYIGFITAVIGFIYGIIIIINKLIYNSIQVGYSSIMASILFIGGIIMILLGIIGEYIGRIYICINNSPQYVIKEKIGK